MNAERAQRTLEGEARSAFASALSALPGPKGLLVDDTLYVPRLSVTSALDLFADAAFLREHGVRNIAPLSAQARPGRTISEILSLPALVIVIRGVNAAAARAAVTAIRAMQERARRDEETALSNDMSKIGREGVVLPVPPREGKKQNNEPVKFLVLTTPRRSQIVEKILQEAGLPDVPVALLPLGFLPFDADLVSLDWPEAYRQVVLEGDNSALLASAAALSSLGTALNLEYTTIRTAGAAATAVAEELLHTHGQIYPRYYGDNNTSTASSAASSPVILGQSSAFVAHDAFTALDGGSRANGEEEGTASTPTLAEVVGNSRKRRSVNLVIIDRGVDVVTPMLTQWTYEGLLEESIWMHNNVMDLPVSDIVSEDAMEFLSSGPNSSGTAATVRKRLRGDVDPIFRELRDQNYWTAATQIKSVASSVREYYNARPTRETAEIAQVKEYVKGLKEVKSEHWFAAAHTAIAAEISARTFDSYEFKRRFELEREMMEGSTATGRRVYIADAIARGESLCHVLRLCCLWSLTSSGIDSDEFDFVRKEILAIFGLKVLPLLANLERGGMLVRSYREQQQNNLSWIPFANFGGGSGSDAGSTVGSVASSVMSSEDGRRYRSRAASDYSWQFARAAMRLVTDFDPDKQVRPGTAAAISAPYSGYTPLSVRLVEAGLSDEGWSALPVVVAHTSLLPPGHATVEHRRGELHRSLEQGALDGDGFDAVVVFVGGVARAEASAVRLAAQKAGVRVLIATTAVVSPDGFIWWLRDLVMMDSES